jgi:hypothetical protein
VGNKKPGVWPARQNIDIHQRLLMNLIAAGFDPDEMVKP